MDLNKYTQKSQEAVLEAQRLAQDYSHQSIEPAHILLALLSQDEGVVPAIVTKISGSPVALREAVAGDLQGRSKVYGSGGEVGLSRAASDVFAAAERYAKGMKDDYVSTEHILLGLTESGEAKRLTDYGLTKDTILRALASVRGTQRVTTQTPEETYQALERYGRDLTALARTGKLDPVIGRDEEIRRVIQILSRRTKNNPALIGDPVSVRRLLWKAWRSGLSMGMFLRVEAQTAGPAWFSAMVAGQIPREFEERLKATLKEIRIFR
jgi:ATP-dependent Clp protease ATP-binding subunit ClpB